MIITGIKQSIEYLCEKLGLRNIQLPAFYGTVH